MLPLLLAGMWATPALAAPYVSVSAGLGLLNDSDISTPLGSVDNVVGYGTGVPVFAAVGFNLISRTNYDEAMSGISILSSLRISL